ncbi:MAG: HEAT repeat domain-containing protein [Candidatus Aminicenantes bacterium]|nr:HEAT repeat domain-containing protein [Candidatus Aminicenantes bacterium]
MAPEKTAGRSPQPGVGGKGGHSPPPDSSPDKKCLPEVREICASLVRAVSAAKIFPPGHDSIAALQDNVFARLASFLERIPELELEVQKDAFLCRGEAVLAEENPLRSLPYFFYKDGMQKLIFLRGLPREEFSNFIELIRTVSLLPLDESDIVDALWQRDFEHIRYISPDEFVEAKISGDQDLPREFDLDREALHKGRIDFTPEDAAEIARRSLELARRADTEPDEAEGLCARLTEEDARHVEAMVAAERREPAERHFPDLIFELLWAEERAEAFARLLEFLNQHVRARLRKAEFIRLMRLLNRLGELLRRFLLDSPPRATALENFFRAMRENFPAAQIGEVLLERRTFDVKAFFEFLRFIGRPGLPLAADLFEKIGRLGFREEAGEFFEQMAGEDLRQFLRQGREDRPLFTIAAIDICARRRDPAATPFLLDVLKWKSKDVRLRAAGVLGTFADERARSGLRRLFQDPDEDIRVEALKSIQAGDDRGVLDDLIALASARAFRSKSEAEREAVVAALGRSRADEASAILGRLLRKRRLFGPGRRPGTRLAAVRALEAMATPPAVEALKACRKARPKPIRKEVEAALRRIVAPEAQENPR